MTLGAPNLMGEIDLKKSAQNLKKLFPDFKHPLISLFIGGDTRSHKLTPDILNEIIERIKTACDTLNYGILVASSRRTSSPIRELLHKEFSSYKKCPLLVLPSDEIPSQPSDLIPGMMGCSELLLVTQDSVSMISEAASSGKKVVVIQTPYPISPKHDRLLKNLTEYLAVSPPHTLDQRIIEKLRDSKLPKVLDDTIKIREALRTLL